MPDVNSFDLSTQKAFDDLLTNPELYQLSITPNQPDEKPTATDNLINIARLRLAAHLSDPRVIAELLASGQRDELLNDLTINKLAHTSSTPDEQVHFQLQPTWHTLIHDQDNGTLALLLSGEHIPSEQVLTSMLITAVDAENDAVVKILLDHWPDLINQTSHYYGDDTAITTLFDSGCSWEDGGVCHLMADTLLSHNANVRVVVDDHSVLMKALHNGASMYTQALLIRGADPAFESQQGCTAFITAINANCYAAANKVLEALHTNSKQSLSSLAERNILLALNPPTNADEPPIEDSSAFDIKPNVDELAAVKYAAIHGCAHTIAKHAAHPSYPAYKLLLIALISACRMTPSSHSTHTRADNEQAIHHLLTVIADPNLCLGYSEPNCALYVAAETNHLTAITLLLADPRIDTNSNSQSVYWNENNHIHTSFHHNTWPSHHITETFNKTPLMIAAENGHLAAVKLFVQAANIIIDLTLIRDHSTALILAANNGHLAVVQCLLAAGANPLHPFGPMTHDKKCYGLTALGAAQQSGHQAVADCIQTHILANHPKSTSDHSSPRHQKCSESDCLELTKRQNLLLESSPSIQGVPLYRAFQLLLAVHRNHATVVQFLLALDPSLVNSPHTLYSRTAFATAVRSNNTDIIDLFLAYNADALQSTSDKPSALILSIQYTHYQLANTLLRHAYKMSGQPDKNANDFLRYASSILSTGVKQSLITPQQALCTYASLPASGTALRDEFAKVQARLAPTSTINLRRFLHTTLMHAVEANAAAAVKSLLHIEGVNANLDDEHSRGETHKTIYYCHGGALRHAINRRFFVIASTLLRAGGDKNAAKRYYCNPGKIMAATAVQSFFRRRKPCKQPTKPLTTATALRMVKK